MTALVASTTRSSPAVAAKPLLAVDEMSIRFGGLIAVASLSFVLREGEVLSLIGPNGAGKTSAFNAITGYLQPSSGSIELAGLPLNGLSPDAISRLGIVRTFQKTSLFGSLTAFENVLVGLHKQSGQKPWAIILGLVTVRRDEERLAALAREVLDFVGIRQLAEQPATSLPYGAQRLLEVAIALAAAPKILLLDEPVSGMNPSEKASFEALLGRIRQRGITILLVEHDMRTVMGVSDRVICLNQGRIIADDNPAGIQKNPEVIKAYLGERSQRARH